MATQHFSSDSTRILIDEQEFFRSTLKSKYLFIKLLTLKTLNHKEPIAAYFCPIIKLEIGENLKKPITMLYISTTNHQ